MLPQERMQHDTGELRVDSAAAPPDRFSETLTERQAEFPSPDDVLTPAPPDHALGHVAEKLAEHVVDVQGAIAERQGDELMPQVVEPGALQLQLLRARESVLAELAAAEEEVVESEDMELVEEFDKSVDRFEHSSWRPMRFCALYRGGGCVGRWECTCAHCKLELHFGALVSRPW